MTELDHNSERKECERELQNMPGKWRVARKNGRCEFRLSIKPGVHYVVIQYRAIKPVGWVSFEAKMEKMFANKEAWTRRKKIDARSFSTPGAAATSLVLANLIPI